MRLLIIPIYIILGIIPFIITESLLLNKWNYNFHDNSELYISRILAVITGFNGGVMGGCMIITDGMISKRNMNIGYVGCIITQILLYSGLYIYQINDTSHTFETDDDIVAFVMMIFLLLITPMLIFGLIHGAVMLYMIISNISFKKYTEVQTGNTLYNYNGSLIEL